MRNLVKFVQDTNSQHKLWSEGEKMIIGVSGGPDSMCLLDIMRRISAKNNLEIIVAHVNYGLRGDDSDSDEKLVMKYAKEHNIVCEVLHYEDMSNGNENVWRNTRYDFFNRLAKKHKVNKILVAHTKNDQAETFLMHLLRGGGLQGLSAMRVVSDGGIIRPLLNTERRDVLVYCEDNNIKYNIDKTNNDKAFMRNRIRLDLLPKIKKEYNSNIVSTLASSASVIADDYDFLLSNVDIFWKKEKNSIIFSAKKFVDKHPSLQRATIRIMIKQIKGNVNDIDNSFVEELRKAIGSTKNKHQTVYKKDLKLTKKGDTVRFMGIE